MKALHFSPRTVQVTRTFAQGGLLAAIAAVSLISLGTLLFVWYVS